MIDDYELIVGEKAQAICRAFGLTATDASQTVQFRTLEYSRSVTAAGKLNSALTVISIDEAPGCRVQVTVTDYSNRERMIETAYLEGNGYNLIQQSLDPRTSRGCGAPTCPSLPLDNVSARRADVIQRARTIFGIVDQPKAIRPVPWIPGGPNAQQRLG